MEGLFQQSKDLAKALFFWFIAALEHSGYSITNAFKTMINQCHCVDFV